jgi:hypothetical protein
LKIRDILSLGQTCQSFYRFFNDDNFWIHRIRAQFPTSIAQLYIFDLFKKPEIIETYNEIRPSGFSHVQTGNELDHLAINSATHYNDEAIAKRNGKMYVSKEEFFNDLEFYQFNQPTDYSAVPFMKLIYFYLIDRKRSAAVEMNIIHRGLYDLIEDDDVDSLTGHIISLKNASWLEITGRLEHKIIPGKYEVSWRMKCNKLGTYMRGETEFIVVPQHGKLLDYRMSEDDFHTLTSKHEDRWFVIKMGEIIIYEPSIILVGIRNWNETNWKSNLSWDCIELTLVP